LEGALLLKRIYPSASFLPPIEFNFRRRPKPIYLDTALVVHALQAREALLARTPLNEIFQGRIAEQIVGQALLEASSATQSQVGYWQRGKETSTAEVDFLLNLGGKLMPIEVKSGTSGKLRSLHQFFEESQHPIGVCINSYPPRIEEIKTRSNKSGKIIFLPFYLAHRLEELFL
jgi:hypothetical protein